MRKAFTLVEIGIATFIATTMAIILLTLMNRFMGRTAETSQIMVVARESSVILRLMKMSVREADNIETGEHLLRCTKGGKQAHFFRFDNTKEAIEYTNPNGKKMFYAVGNVLGFSSELASHQANVFRLILHFKDPRVPRGGTEEASADFSAIVSQRVNVEVFSDPAWILNEQDSCPPNCGS